MTLSGDVQIEKNKLDSPGLRKGGGRMGNECVIVPFVPHLVSESCSTSDEGGVEGILAVGKNDGNSDEREG